jgi:signal transduction histidine kinase
MFKTLISKFSFFFWLIFLILNILIYFFTTVYIKEILTKSESDKITLMLNTLKPAIAYDISFNQTEQLTQLLDTILQDNSIKSIQIIYTDKKKTIKEKVKEKEGREKLFSYTTALIDPFSQKTVAHIKLAYSNENINTLQKKILLMQLYIFLIALFLFSLFFLYVKRDLNALRTIANSLQEYSKFRTIKSIVLDNRSTEVQTIANVANAMITDIAEYVKELKTFNAKLEAEVAQEVQKAHKQEKMMLHQSRQAAMGEVLESIAHQWRQPLNIIGIAVSNLEMQSMLGKLDEKDLQAKLELIATNTNYMSDTIDDFRNFLNPQREKKSFNPKNSIEDILHILGDELKNHHIHHTIKEKNVLTLFGIENEFKQLIMILINNAKDAITSQIKSKSIPFGEILIFISKEKDKAVIVIEDNGGGINADIIESIFEPYFSTKFSSHGTGIGLYIGKSIVKKRLKGSLTVHNTAKGCCFTIKIPMTTSQVKEVEK